jgi:hypothetical protein
MPLHPPYRHLNVRADLGQQKDSHYYDIRSLHVRLFCVPAIAAIPPDISNVGGPTHQIEARLGCEIALFLMSTAKTPGPRDIFTNLERRSLEADEQVNEQVITYFYL